MRVAWFSVSKALLRLCIFASLPDSPPVIWCWIQQSCSSSLSAGLMWLTAGTHYRCTGATSPLNCALGEPMQGRHCLHLRDNSHLVLLVRCEFAELVLRNGSRWLGMRCHCLEHRFSFSPYWRTDRYHRSRSTGVWAREPSFAFAASTGALGRLSFRPCRRALPRLHSSKLEVQGVARSYRLRSGGGCLSACRVLLHFVGTASSRSAIPH